MGDFSKAQDFSQEPLIELKNQVAATLVKS